MLELTPLSLKERFWLPAAVAFGMHSLIISALTVGFGQKDKKYSPVVSVEIIFDQNKSATEMNLLCEQTASQADVKETVNTISDGASFQKRTKKASRQSEAKLRNATIVQEEACSNEADGNNFELLYNPAPLYPIEARRKNIEGVVHLRVHLSSDGTVENVVVLPPKNNPLLEKAAVDAVRQWKVKSLAKMIEVPIEFRLEP